MVMVRGDVAAGAPMTIVAASNEENELEGSNMIRPRIRSSGIGLWSLGVAIVAVAVACSGATVTSSTGRSSEKRTNGRGN
jgi:hypothetical protein